MGREEEKEKYLCEKDKYVAFRYARPKQLLTRFYS